MNGKNTQPRARRTRAKLLAALEDLLKEKPFDQVAVTEIAKTAGVAVGSVYSHFADKEAFLEALLEKWQGQVEERLAINLASDLEAEFKAEGSLRAALQMIVRYNHEVLEKEKHLIRAVHQYLRQKIDAQESDWIALQERAFETVAKVVDVYAAEVRRRDHTQAKIMLNYYLNAIFSDRTIYQERSAPGVMALSDEQFVHEVAEMAYAYLVTPD